MRRCHVAEPSRFEEYCALLKRRRRDLIRAISAGDSTAVVAWFARDQIGLGPRPLRFSPVFEPATNLVAGPVAQRAVEDWVMAVGASGARSVISLTELYQLDWYSLVSRSGSLLQDLEEQGLVVAHQPLVDPAHLPEGQESRIASHVVV